MSDGENRRLSAQVGRLETELARSAGQLTRLRGALRSAVRDSLTDPLTGLANRRSFDLKLDAAVAGADGSAPIHLVMADVDHFKRINDAHGHDIGDEVLRVFGQILSASVRDDSVVARVGGDEFALLLRGVRGPHVAAIANRLCRLMASRPLAVCGRSEIIERITVSFGVAACHGSDSSTRWFGRADAMLLEAKRRGGNRVVSDPSRPIAAASPGGADDREAAARRSCAAVWPPRADEGTISSDPPQPAAIRRSAR